MVSTRQNRLMWGIIGSNPDGSARDLTRPSRHFPSHDTKENLCKNGRDMLHRG
jgi:hypothetical protein